MTRDDIIRMAREAGYGEAMSDLHAPALERFAALVAAHEREACLEIVERRCLVDATKAQKAGYLCAQRSIADGIRSRGQA